MPHFFFTLFYIFVFDFFYFCSVKFIKFGWVMETTYTKLRAEFLTDHLFRHFPKQKYRSFSSLRSQNTRTPIVSGSMNTVEMASDGLRNIVIVFVKTLDPEQFPNVSITNRSISLEEYTPFI